MSYCIVSFDNESEAGGQEEVAVIHKNWIFEDKCYWPPFWRNTNKLTSAIKGGMKPEFSSWKMHSVHIVAGKYYETYEEARKKLDVSQFGSELSNEENTRQRKKKPRAPVESDSDCGSENEEEESLKIKQSQQKKKSGANARTQITIPKPPTPQIATATPASASLKDTELGSRLVSNDQYLQSIRRLPLGYGLPGRTPPPCASMFTPERGNSNLHGHSPNPQSQLYQINPSPASQIGDSQDLNFSSDHHRSVGSTYETPRRVAAGPQREKAGIDELVKRVESLEAGQQLLSVKMDLALDMLRTILQGKQIRNLSSEYTGISLPMDAIEKVREWDATIRQDSKIKDNFITMLSNKGGNNANDITYRIMAMLMTDDIMSRYSMAGQRGNLCFRDTIFVTCICEAVRRIPKGSVASDKEIEKAIEYWLKKAPLRIANKSKKSPLDNFEELDSC